MDRDRRLVVPEPLAPASRCGRRGALVRAGRGPPGASARRPSSGSPGRRRPGRQRLQRPDPAGDPRVDRDRRTRPRRSPTPRTGSGRRAPVSSPRRPARPRSGSGGRLTRPPPPTSRVQPPRPTPRPPPSGPCPPGPARGTPRLTRSAFSRSPTRWARSASRSSSSPTRPIRWTLRRVCWDASWPVYWRIRWTRPRLTQLIGAPSRLVETTRSMSGSMIAHSEQQLRRRPLRRDDPPVLEILAVRPVRPRARQRRPRRVDRFLRLHPPDYPRATRPPSDGSVAAGARRLDRLAPGHLGQLTARQDPRDRDPHREDHHDHQRARRPPESAGAPATGRTRPP